jgi:hypothetical protein
MNLERMWQMATNQQYKKNLKKGSNEHKNAKRLNSAYFNKEPHGLGMNTQNVDCVDPSKEANGLGININRHIHMVASKTFIFEHFFNEDGDGPIELSKETNDIK